MSAAGANHVALLRRVFALEFKRAFAYRAEFWLGFLGNALSQFAVAYLLWSSIFEASGVEVMRGLTLRDLSLYYLLIPLVERVTLGAEMSHISGEIYDGTLNRYLVYPVSFFGFKYASSLAQSLVYAGQMALLAGLCLAVFGVPPAFHFTPAGVSLALAALMLGTVLYFALAACIEMVAFWADNVWSLMVLVKLVLHFLGGGLIPLAFFPGDVRAALEWTPFPYLVSFPLRFVMEGVNGIGAAEAARGFAILLAWIAGLSCLARFVWARGSRQYTGVGI
jgi:ABC-2 type transport system permease protein